MSKSQSTHLWSAHFPGRSLSDTEGLPKLVSPCGAENLLLVAWEGHRANCHHQTCRELSSVLGKAWQHYGWMLCWIC